MIVIEAQAPVFEEPHQRLLSGERCTRRRFTTSVSGSTPLNRLTSGQATQLCNDVTRENTTTLEPMLCTSWSHSGALITTGAYFGQPPTATDADLQTKCGFILTVLYPSGCVPAVTCDAAGLASNPPSCTATVADVADCLDGNYALEKDCWRPRRRAMC